MTKLQRKVKRSVTLPRGKTLVIEVEPLPVGEGTDALIRVREKNRRKGFEVTASALVFILAQREADAQRATRRSRRRRGGLL